MARAKSKVNSTTGGLPNWAVIQPGMEPLKLNGMLKDYKRLLWEAEYYVHYEIATSSFVSAFIKYCEREFDKKEPALLKKLSEYDMTVVGKWAYLAMKGVGLEETKKAFMKNKYEELIVKARAIAAIDKQKAAEKAKEKSVSVVISIPQRMREQVGDLCAEFDNLVDEFCVNNLSISDFNPHTMMKVYKSGVIKPAHAKIIREMYEGQYNEALEIVAWKDEQIKEGYAYMTPKMRKEYLAFFEKIITACDTYINTGKAVRKTRMPKAVSKEKKVAKLKYQVSEPTLGLASINPIQILDATMLWVYNSKTRKLGCYIAEHAGNLSAKGASIIGFDEAKSIQKTIRKPEVLLKGIDKLPRTKMQKLFDEIKATETKMNGRLNDTTILLKAF